MIRKCDKGCLAGDSRLDESRRIVGFRPDLVANKFCRPPSGFSALQSSPYTQAFDEERKLKLPKFVLMLALLASVSAQAAVDPYRYCRNRNDAITDAMNVLTDVIVIRPVGFAGTLAGGALFLGLSPLIALAAIPEPHDSFDKMGVLLVGVPYHYTFVRPLGYFSTACN